MSSFDIFDNKIIVDELLKSSEFNRTEKVYVSMPDGTRKGPYIRKVFDDVSGLGVAYECLAKKCKDDDFSPFLAKVLSVKNYSGQMHVFEEFYTGTLLNEYIKTRDMSDNFVKLVFSQVCKAVDYLHNCCEPKIIHRDIKPQNIIVLDDGSGVKLIDYGIARNYDERESSDTKKFGTVGYAAPEQFGYQQTDQRSDVYSLGKLLEFLCDAKNWKNSHSDIGIEKFDDVINKACQFDPKLRFKDVSFLLKSFLTIDNTSSNKFLLWLGHIWNTMLLATMVFFIIVVFNTVCDSANVNYYMPIGQKITYCFMMIVFCFFGGFAALSYKPSLRRIFKKLPRFGFKHYIILILVCIAGITISAFLAQLF